MDEFNKFFTAVSRLKRRDNCVQKCSNLNNKNINIRKERKEDKRGNSKKKDADRRKGKKKVN